MPPPSDCRMKLRPPCIIKVDLFLNRSWINSFSLSQSWQEGVFSLPDFNPILPLPCVILREPRVGAPALCQAAESGCTKRTHHISGIKSVNLMLHELRLCTE